MKCKKCGNNINSTAEKDLCHFCEIEESTLKNRLKKILDNFKIECRKCNGNSKLGDCVCHYDLRNTFLTEKEKEILIDKIINEINPMGDMDVSK